MQGSGIFFYFFTGDTFSATVNPADVATAPGNLFRNCYTKVDIKSLVNTLYLRYFMVIFTMQEKNTCY